MKIIISISVLIVALVIAWYLGFYIPEKNNADLQNKKILIQDCLSNIGWGVDANASRVNCYRLYSQ